MCQNEKNTLKVSPWSSDSSVFPARSNFFDFRFFPKIVINTPPFGEPLFGVKEVIFGSNDLKYTCFQFFLQLNFSKFSIQLTYSSVRILAELILASSFEMMASSRSMSRFDFYGCSLTFFNKLFCLKSLC